MMEEAIACGSYRDPEPMAWVTARLAFLQWQSGDSETALRTADRALAIVPDYPHALWVIGRVQLAQHQTQASIAALEKAIAKSPLLELQWALIDAYQAAGESAKAAAVEATLKRSGAAEDPRSFSLYLATQGLLPERALSLATAELKTRSDVFTHDALAWAQHAVGQHAEALASIRQALAEGTLDARLFLHAGVIAQASSSNQEATQWLGKAQSMRGLLLPSEQSALDRSLAAVAALSTRPDQPSLVNDTTK